MLACVSWYTHIAMEGSSESGWERSASSRGLNRNPRILRANRGRLYSGNTSHDSELMSVRKGSERPPSHYRAEISGGGDAAVLAVECNDVSLRQWLDNPERIVDPLECLHIFSQIVDVVNLSHLQGIVVHNVRPSCFIMSSYNRVSFIESASCSDSGSDSPEYGATDSHPRRNPRINSETSCLQSSPGHALEATGNERTADKNQSFPMKQILQMESNWYTTPEEASGSPTSCASDIYQLGVLLFEVSLFG